MVPPPSAAFNMMMHNTDAFHPNQHPLGGLVRMAVASLSGGESGDRRAVALARYREKRLVRAPLLEPFHRYLFSLTEK